MYIYLQLNFRFDMSIAVYEKDENDGFVKLWCYIKIFISQYLQVTATRERDLDDLSLI